MFAKEKEVSLKETFRQKSIQAANLNNLKLELEALRASFDQLLKQLPTDKEIPNLIQELNQAASKNGLQLSGLSPLGANKMTVQFSVFHIIFQLVVNMTK